MASELSAADYRAYAEGIDRLGGVFALASLVPVVFATRFDLKGAGRAGLKRKAKDQGEDGEQEGDDAQAAPGVGLPCVLLLIASEVVGSLDLFMPVPQAKAKSKGKLKDVVAAVGFQAILKGLEKGKKAAKPRLSGGTLDAATTFISALLESKEAFDAILCVVTMAACVIVIMSMLFRGVPSLSSYRRGGGKQFMCFVGMALSIAIFGWYQQVLLLKVGKAVMSEQLLPTLRIPLRVFALLAAALPAGDRGGSPVLFVALQVGSLVSSLSSQLVQGEVHRAIAPFQQQPVLDAILAPSIHVWLVPAGVAVLWVFVGHLQGNLGGLAMASLLACATSPMVLAKFWPSLCDLTGLVAADSQAAAGHLVRFASMTLAASGVSLFVASGTQGILASMLMLQVMLRIHGHEALLAAVS